MIDRKNTQWDTECFTTGSVILKSRFQTDAFSMELHGASVFHQFEKMPNTTD